MLRKLPAPTFVHRVIAWARDGKWMICPCCGNGFGSHQLVNTVNGPSRLYNRLSYMCPSCVAERGTNVVVITPPRPCSCPDCGHIETSLSAMGRHWTQLHGHQDASF